MTKAKAKPKKTAYDELHEASRLDKLCIQSAKAQGYKSHIEGKEKALAGFARAQTSEIMRKLGGTDTRKVVKFLKTTAGKKWLKLDQKVRDGMIACMKS